MYLKQENLFDTYQIIEYENASKTILQFYQGLMCLHLHLRNDYQFFSVGRKFN